MRLEFNVLYFLKLELIPVKNESNVVVLFICTFRDITSFKVDIFSFAMQYICIADVFHELCKSNYQTF